MAAWGETTTTLIPAPDVRSISWHGDDLVDWVSGGRRFGIHDGVVQPRSVFFAFPFDASVSSPKGDVAVIFQRLGTKGLLLHEGQLVRELNRSYYCADKYEYPVCLFERNGRTLLAHCPAEYNLIEIEDALTGESLTARARDENAADFFHSRLQVDGSGQHLVSAGWVWHPWDAVAIFDIEACLKDPTGLDSLTGSIPESRHVGLAEEASACWLGEGSLLITANSEGDADELEEEQPELLPNGFVVYNVADRAVTAAAQLDRPAGTVMRVDQEHFVAFFEYPRLIRIGDGAVLHEWPNLATGNQLSSIVHHIDLPILALDPARGRFAVTQDNEIHAISIEIAQRSTTPDAIPRGHQQEAERPHR